MKRLMALLFVILLVSCTSRQDHEDTLNSWIGHNENKLLESWGTPSKHYSTKDTKYLTWENRSQQMFGGYNAYYGTYTTPYMINYKCDITMIIKDDKVSSWRYEGNNCYDY